MSEPVLKPFKPRLNEVDVFGALLVATAALFAAVKIEKQRNMKPVPMTFGQAIEALKEGARVRRSGWNGKGMYLFLVKVSFATNPDAGARVFAFEPAICMYTAQGTNQIGWLASQADMLGEDWEIVPLDYPMIEARGGGAV